VVAGGTFNNVTNNYATAPIVTPGGFNQQALQEYAESSSDFRMIALGDIYLQKEIGLGGGRRTVRDRLHDRGSVRRVYSARVVGLDGNKTVAMYQGNGAEDVCYILLS
jgi:hypothetical protein